MKKEDLSILFITSNDGKVRSMKKWIEPLGIRVLKNRRKIILREEKLPTVEDTAVQKALEVRKIFDKPFVVQDSGFFLDARPGFPGPNVNHILSTIGISGILEMVSGNVRTCYFKDVLAFWSPVFERKFKSKEIIVISEDGYNIFSSSSINEKPPESPLALFISEVYGTLAFEPSEMRREGAWSDLWRIFIPEGFTCTLASMDRLEQQRFNEEVRNKPKANSFIVFANWIKEQNHIDYLYIQSSFENLVKSQEKGKKRGKTVS